MTTAVRFLRLIACLMMLLTLQALGGVFSSTSVEIVSSASPDTTDTTASQSPALAAFPFYDGFESGSLGSDWTVYTTNEGRVQVAASYPYSGTYSLLLDDYSDDSIDSLAAAILTIDLSSQSQVDLDFWCHDFTDVADPEDGVFISDDDGTTWHQVLDLNSIPNFYRHYIIDLDAEAASAGMALNDHFQIKFQFYEDDPVPVDGLAIDEVQVRSPPVPVPATFPYHDDFESGSLGDEWLIDFTNEGRVQVADSYPYSGTYSLLLDDYRDDSIYSLAAAILTIDLSGQPDVMLDFWWRGFYDEAHPEDGVFISDDDGTTWYPVLSFEQTGAWQREVIDLDAEAASAGMVLNDHFQIKFQFYEDDPIPSDGYAIDEVQVRPNAPPVLTWPGDTNYEQDGLDPESGDIRDTYVYRIKYADADGDPPALVQVHIDKGGIGIAGSPFTMDCIPGDYVEGVICSHSQEGLEEGSDYTYSFAGQDDRGNQAQSTPVLDAPDVTVTYWIHLPLVMRNAGPPAGPPHLDPIDNPSGHYSYTISWSTVERATRYTLEEDDNPSFPSPEVVYSGSHTSTSVVVQATGTYYYRVKASNKFGETGWSNTRSTVVTVAPPPCPQPGYWAGFTDQGYAVNYDLADTPDCEVTRLRITARLDCVMNPVDLEYTVEYFFSAPVVAREFEYYVSYGDYSERVSGTFSSQTAATGRWFFFVPDPNFPVPGRFCTGGGSWSATYRP